MIYYHLGFKFIKPVLIFSPVREKGGVVWDERLQEAGVKTWKGLGTVREVECIFRLFCIVLWEPDVHLRDRPGGFLLQVSCLGLP